MIKNVGTTEYLLLLDWFSFSAKFSSWEEAVDFLGLSDFYGSFVECPGYNFYNEGIRFSDITILRGNKNMIDSYFIEMKGRGCRSFEEHSVYSLDEYLLPAVYELGFSVSRCDIALDLQNHPITIDKFVKAYEAGLYKTKCKSTDIHKSNRNGVHGASLYFGLQKSDVRINIYDKRAERSFSDDSNSWVRFELRLRHDAANNFLKSYIESSSLGYCFWGIVNNYLCFLKKSDDANRNRWPPAPWWYKLRQHSEKISVFTQPGVEYDFSKYEHEIIQQCGSRIKYFLTIYSAFDLWQRIEKSDIQLNEKQKEFLLKRLPDIDLDILV